MTNTSTRKHKVELADYSYQRDIANRQLLAELTEFEVLAVEEIVNGSLKTTIDQLACVLEADTKTLQPLLERLHEVELLKIEGHTVTINKEMRKYYCCELAKFNTFFEPDLQHLQALLQKVPIHILPLWYAIPRTSDNIFQSILERYFQTPRTYQKYIEELALENPVLYRLFEALQATPDFSLSAKTVMEQLNLSKEQFHELILSFEYHLGGGLCYRKEASGWQAYVSIYQEWKQYQSFLRCNAPSAIEDDHAVERFHSSDFGFIEDLATLLRLALQKSIPLATIQTPASSLQFYEQHFPHLVKASALTLYFSSLLRFATYLHLLKQAEDNIVACPQEIKSWLKKNKQDQASDIYCLVLSATRQNTDMACSEREFREIEKALKKVAHRGWIYFDDFLKGSTASIGKNSPVALLQKGKKWRYTLPCYTQEEQDLFSKVVFGPFFYAAHVATGMHLGRPCFRITPYGRMSLGD